VVFFTPGTTGLAAGSRRGNPSRVFHAVSATQGAYLRYAPLFELLESLELDAPLVRRLREEALQSSVRPSESMRRFQRGLGWFELRHNGMIHPFANVFLLWDVHCVLGLEAWQARAGRFVRRWFQAIGDLEALSSFAGLAHDDAGYSFPKVSAEGAHFTAEGLAHPLIAAERRVANDVSLPEAGRALLVTGSNMSGKSTLLRSMGLATVMALAGAPACARRLAISPLAVRTSIRISDSLEHGVSHFYAEVGKIKAVLDATGEGTTVFFLLDEILHGTNSEERQIGARWVLAELLRRGALGAVSTHDIELCRLDSPLMNRVALHHFREQVKNDAMSFDYTLRTGPVEGGNALRLMRLSGIDVPLAPSRAADSSVTPKT
jgi:DNA mismatch repair ATPase MutS